MANKKVQKGITKKRMNEIENYLFSINGLVNPCSKDMTRKNVIGVEVAKQALRVLNEELDGYAINMDLIDLEGIYSEKERSETDDLICQLSDGLVVASYQRTYNELVRGEILEQAYPEGERKVRMEELEKEIQKQMQIVETLEQVNPSLAKNKEKEIQVLSQELESIKETLQLPTREELILRLYSAVTHKLDSIKEQCNERLNYLEGVLD
ncbi:MAG: hypothetical protein Q4F05_02470 [bacterium]|nr:hypothetical protein [bacterium]